VDVDYGVVLICDMRVVTVTHMMALLLVSLVRLCMVMFVVTYIDGCGVVGLLSFVMFVRGCVYGTILVVVSCVCGVFGVLRVYIMLVVLVLFMLVLMHVLRVSVFSLVVLSLSMLLSSIVMVVLFVCMRRRCCAYRVWCCGLARCR